MKRRQEPTCDESQTRGDIAKNIMRFRTQGLSATAGYLLLSDAIAYCLEHDEINWNNLIAIKHYDAEAAMLLQDLRDSLYEFMREEIFALSEWER